MRRSRVLALLATLAFAALVVLAVGCDGDDEEATVGTTAAGPPLVVGSDIPFPPFEQGRPPDYEGFDIELVNAIADRIGREVEIQDTAFDTIFTDLQQGKFDLVASATTIKPGREERVDFSDPYYLSDQALLVEEGSDIRSEADLAGKTVGAQDATTGETFANDETDAKTVRGFPEGPDAVSALRGGQVDAVIIDLPAAQDAVKEQGGIEIATTFTTDEEFGFAVQEGDQELLDAVNAALKEIKDDGTFADIYKKWFGGKEPPQEVLDATHEPS